MQNILLVLQLLLAIALVGVILIQRTAQDGGGLGGGSTMGGLFTARGSANLLTRTTAILATLFIVNSLVLGAMASAQHHNKSLLDQLATPAPTQTAPAAPAAPQVPVAK